MSTGLSLQSLVVPNPLCPVYELADEGDTNYAPHNLTIWPTDGKHDYDPVVVSNSGSHDDPSATLIVHLKGEEWESYMDKQFILLAYVDLDTSTFSPLHDTVFTFERDESSGAAIAAVTMTFKSFSHLTGRESDRSIPYGFHDKLRFRVKEPGSEALVNVDGEAPVEIYAIVNDLPNEYTSYGIPAPLLRLMVKPILEANRADHIKTFEDYVKWTAHRLHKSSVDGLNLDDGYEGPIHTYRYDIWSYSSRFSDFYTESERGRWNPAFQLDDWLRHREDRAPYVTINCYDCAGILMCCLAFGIPVDNIQWTLIKPFGYLPAEGTSLIGWGQVNTTNRTISLGPEAGMIKPYESTERKGFGNHAMVTVSWDPQADILSRKALDVCAGPAAGDLTLKRYIDECIDEKRPTLTGDERATDKSASLCGLLGSLDQLRRDPKSWTARVFKKNSPEAEWLEKVAGIELNGVKRTETTVDFARMFPQIKEALDRLSDVVKKDDKPYVEIHPGVDHNKVVWKYRGIQVTLYIFESHHDAVAWAPKLAHLTDCSMPEEVLEMVKKSGDDDGPIRLQGRSDRGWFVYINHNILAEIECMDATDPDAEKKATRVEDIVDEYVRSPANIVETREIDNGEERRKGLDLHISPKSEFTVKRGEVFKITVKAPKAAAVKAFARTGMVYLQDVHPKKDEPKNDDPWVFTFVARGQGNDKIVFTGLHGETYQLPSRRYDVNILVE